MGDQETFHGHRGGGYFVRLELVGGRVGRVQGAAIEYIQTQSFRRERITWLRHPETSGGYDGDKVKKRFPHTAEHV